MCVCVCVCVCVFFNSIVRATRLTDENTSACRGEPAQTHSYMSGPFDTGASNLYVCACVCCFVCLCDFSPTQLCRFR